MKYPAKVILALLFAVIAVPLWADDGKKGVDPKQILEKTDFEVGYGNADAPVVITEYSSFSCPYCKRFHAEIIDKIMASYIDAGKVYYIFRHFPLNMPALRASMLVQCVQDSEQKRRFVKVLFERQNEWASAENEQGFLQKTRVIAQDIGIDTSLFQACAEDEDLEDQVLTFQARSSSVGEIRSTPTLFINGEKYVDDRALKPFAAALDKALKKAAEEKKENSGSLPN